MYAKVVRGKKNITNKIAIEKQITKLSLKKFSSEVVTISLPDITTTI
jgi:hypothetical protein